MGPDDAVRLGKKPGILSSSAMSFASISLFSLIFRALLTTKLSSSSGSESCALLCTSGSDAGLLLAAFLVGKGMATFRTLGLRPRLFGVESTFMAFILLLITLSSKPLHVSSSDVASNTFGFSADLLVCLKLLLVFAKPPSEPKLSQLSSEEDEEEVSMEISEELRKLLRLILVDGDWAASFMDRVDGIFPVVIVP